MAEYTPTTEEMKAAWRQYAHAQDAKHGRLRDDTQSADEEFERWLSEHDALVKADALAELVRARGSVCPYCVEGSPEDPGCPASSGYACTRRTGHDGPHVACGTEKHSLYTWEEVEGR